MNNIKIKISEMFQKMLAMVKPKLVMIDTKIDILIPNPKTKKVLYIALGSLFGFMFLVVVLGLLLSPFRNKQTDLGTKLNKTNVINVSPEPQRELSETQKKLLKLETDAKEMTFPDSKLNMPVIESNLSF